MENGPIRMELILKDSSKITSQKELEHGISPTRIHSKENMNKLLSQRINKLSKLNLSGIINDLFLD